jgi:putative nucleotidyltransferase with HDIG domain
VIRIAKVSSNIRAQLPGIDKLAPLPLMVRTVMEIINDPHSSARSLSDVIKRDQSLTAKILQIVNSAYYGFYREIGNIDHAVVILGFNEITNITLAACIIQTYRNGQNPYFSREQFWTHTLGAAYVARGLRAYIPEIISKDAFVIGLLHDIGKVVLDQHFKEGFIRALEMAADQKRSLHEVCRELLDIDHAEIGGEVAEKWNLPVPLVNAIRGHHMPGLAGQNDYCVHLAHLANYFAHRLGIGASGNPAPDEPHPESLKVFGFDGKDLDAVWGSLNIDAGALKQIL